MSKSGSQQYLTTGLVLVILDISFLNGKTDGTESPDHR